MSIAENIKTVKASIEAACRKAGRSPADALLVAVTKTRAIDEINAAIDAGITDIGENKVQEIMDKFDGVKQVRWHMIGHLQTNKVKYIIDKVSLIHSVDSVKLAEEIDKRAAQRGITMDILVQVNAAEEESKSGISKEETDQLVGTILGSCPNLRIRGFMCIAPYEDDPEDVRIWFRQVKQLYDHYSGMQRKGLEISWLSMGMSHDFEAAIMEGSNLVRIGTAIFGERNYSK